MRHKQALPFRYGSRSAQWRCSQRQERLLFLCPSLLITGLTVNKIAFSLERTAVWGGGRDARFDGR